MDLNTLVTSIQILIPPAVGVFMYLIKRIFMRIDNMAEEQKQFITHAEARSLIKDLQEPMRVSLRNIEFQLTRILNELEKKK